MSLLGYLGLGDLMGGVVGMAAQRQQDQLNTVYQGGLASQTDPNSLEALQAVVQNWPSSSDPNSQWVQQAAGNWVNGTITNPPSNPVPTVVMDISRMKLHAQIIKLVDQLPMSIAGTITECTYYEKDHDEAARFVIMFSNRRTLTFYDVDKFPSDEHIGRIALECP